MYANAGGFVTNFRFKDYSAIAHLKNKIILGRTIYSVDLGVFTYVTANLLVGVFKLSPKYSFSMFTKFCNFCAHYLCETGFLDFSMSNRICIFLHNKRQLNQQDKKGFGIT